MPITLNSLRASSPGSPGVGGEKLVFFRPPTLYSQRPPCCSVQQERGKEPGTIGAGGVWEAEAKRAGGGISKRVGSGGNRGQLPNDAKYFAMEKGLKRGSQENRGGGRVVWTPHSTVMVP